MSDIFGIETDNSLEIQEKETRYRKLRDKKRLSANEKAELDQLIAFLSNRPIGGRSTIRLQEEEVELLQQIRKELQGPKS